MMKTGTKIGIGLGIAAVAGISVVVIASEKVVEKLHHESTRYKAKKIVKDKLGGNEKLLNLVDDLSDNELDSIEHVVKEVKHNRDKIHSYGEQVKSNAKNTAENLTDKFFETVAKN